MAWHSLCRKSYNLKLNDLRLPVYLAQFFVILENIGVCLPALLRGPPMLPTLSPDRAGVDQLHVAVARWRTTTHIGRLHVYIAILFGQFIWLVICIKFVSLLVMFVCMYVCMSVCVFVYVCMRKFVFLFC